MVWRCNQFYIAAPNFFIIKKRYKKLLFAEKSTVIVQNRYS